MNDLLFIAFAAGLHDGLSPCVFMAGMVFIVYARWFTLNPWFVGCLRFFFGLVYLVGIFVFNFGPAQSFVLNNIFVLADKVLYFFLGLGAFVLGVLFFKDWYRLGHGTHAEMLAGRKIKFFSIGGVVLFLVTIVMPVVLSVASTLWPIDKYILALGNSTLSKGQWYTALPLLLTYALVSMWPLWLIWAFLSIKKLRPTMLKIVSAAISFTASSSMVFIFK